MRVIIRLIQINTKFYFKNQIIIIKNVFIIGFKFDQINLNIINFE